MRVFIPTKYISQIGGVQEVVRHLIGMNGIDFSILSCVSKKETIPLLPTQPRVHMQYVKTAFTVLRTPFSFSYILYFFREARASDIIHLHIPYPFAELLVFIFYPLLKNKKLIITYHADIVAQKYLLFLYGPLLHFLLARATRIVATSPVMKVSSNILKKYGDKVTVIPLAAPDVVVETKKDYQSFSYFLFLGRLVYYKGLTYLIDAMQGIAGKLIIAGEGELREELEKKVKELGLTEQILFLGAVGEEKKDELLRGASVFVFPSIETSEAFGLVQAEALSYRLPIINTQLLSGVPWVARNGKEALTVPPKNVKALHTALTELSLDPLLRQRLGENAYVRYQENFTIEQLRETYKELYLNA